MKHKPELSVANSLWIQKDHPWKKDYLARFRDDFRAGLFDVDFQGNADTTRERINRWVEKKTHDRIKDLLPREAITGDTQMILVNAVYFKAKWVHEFKKSNTQPEDFTLANGQKIKVPSCISEMRSGSLEGEKLQVLEAALRGRNDFDVCDSAARPRRFTCPGTEVDLGELGEVDERARRDGRSESLGYRSSSLPCRPN